MVIVGMLDSHRRKKEPEAAAQTQTPRRGTVMTMMDAQMCSLPGSFLRDFINRLHCSRPLGVSRSSDYKQTRPVAGYKYNVTVN